MLRTSRSRASAARSPLGIRRANVSRVSRALTCVLLGFTVHSPALGIETGLEKCLNKTEKDQKLECIEDLARKRAARNAPGNYLDSTWRLAPDDTRLNIDDVQSYRPTYILLGHWTDNVNRQPTSPQLGHTVATPQAWNNDETKFQLSFKSELVSRETFGR